MTTINMASLGTDPVKKKVKFMCFHCEKKVIVKVKCKKCNNSFHPTCLQQASRAKNSVCKHNTEDEDISLQNKDGLRKELAELTSLYDELNKNYLKLEENFEILSEKLDEIKSRQRSLEPVQPVEGRERHPIIWQGVLEWFEKPSNPTNEQKITKHVLCQVSSNYQNGEPEMKADGWPLKLIMQLIPKQLIVNIGGSYLKNSKHVVFHPIPCKALESLTRFMNTGWAGCVHFTRNSNRTPCDIKLLILIYYDIKKAWLGFIPNDQDDYVNRLVKVIQEEKSKHLTQSRQRSLEPVQPVEGRERDPIIWQGVLEWFEKPSNPTNEQKIIRHVLCRVSSKSQNGEPEMKADGWPPKLMMQLIPKQLIGKIGGSYLKNSKTVLFNQIPCEALDSLTRLTNMGFAGCVHFTRNPNSTPCDIRILILIYSDIKKAWLGFIPNDQDDYVNRLVKVVQEEKSKHLTQQRVVPQNSAPVPNQQIIKEEE